eukprot:5834582-Pyramimonas_sp.AAC.1
MARESTMVRRDIHRLSVLQHQAIPNPVANFSSSRLRPLAPVAKSAATRIWKAVQTLSGLRRAWRMQARSSISGSPGLKRSVPFSSIT